VLCVGLATAACMFLGDSILVPITEVGSVASALGWFAACAAYFFMRPSKGKRAIAALGILVGFGMVLMKLVPVVPGHFSVYEWMALGIWLVLGTTLGWQARIRRMA
jgi:hypothetical protein